MNAENLGLSGSNFYSNVKKIGITSWFSVGLQLNLESNYLKQFYHTKSIIFGGGLLKLS